MSGRVAQVHARAQVQPRCTDLTERIAVAIEDTEPESGLTYRELVQVSYEVEGPTGTQLAAVRRSVARLVRDGRATRGRPRRGLRGRDAVEVHRPLTPAEREARRKAAESFARAFQDRREAERRATPYPVDTGYGGIVDVLVEPVLQITESGVALREARP